MMNTIPTISKSPVATNNLYVPCVPVAISASLVAAQPLAMRLAASATSSTSKLAHLSLTDFDSIQLKKSELRLKVDECSSTDKVLLDVCLVNMHDLFSNLASYQIMFGQLTETDVDEKLQSGVKVALQQVHAFAAAMGLVSADYCVDGVIHPDLALDSCINRWKNNYFLSIELALQLQTDAVYGAAASCLTEICQDGLGNQITLDPTPLAQEDVLVALSTFVDLPFSGVWPVLRKRTSLANSGGVL
jgi:hypothetical protein